MILDVFTAVTEALGVVPAVPSFLGPEFLRQEDAPPRIVWVPTHETVVAGRKTQTNAAAYAARPLRTREAGVDIHVWAADYGSVEVLWQSLEQAVHQVAVGAYELVGATWDQVAALVRSGRVLTAHYRFLIPLADASSTTAIITQAPMTTELQAP